MNKLQKVINISWWIMWGIFVFFCVCLWIYYRNNTKTTEIINIEYCFYLSILGLAAISMLPDFPGKPLLWIVSFFLTTYINHLPEMQELIVLNACYTDDDCQAAKEMQAVKIVGDRIIYIPQAQRRQK